MGSNMYPLSVLQWNPFQGCGYGCSYCKRSFQAQAKRQRRRCLDCYNYRPHTHPERLAQRLPRTGYMQFIFTVASGDVSFCPPDYFERILERIRNEEDRTFLIQSKNPKYFQRFDFPGNVVLGTTIETNRDSLAGQVSKAALPGKRLRDFRRVDHEDKMVTIEPVMDFDLPVMRRWMAAVKPCMIWLGYDSKDTGLVEPDGEKFRELHWALSSGGFTVILKKGPRVP